MSAPAITSTFDADTEGWTMQGDVASFTWEPSSGDPGGHLAWVDAASGGEGLWDAPAAYLGDKSAYYGGGFSYAIEDTGNDLAGADVLLTGDGITLVRVVGQPADNDAWTPYSIKLTETGWHVATIDGADATAGQMQAVLGDLTTLLIRAEYVYGDESGGLDNVAMTACYATGTMILTERGEVAVEALVAGDLVCTASGALRPVKWLGHRRVACARHPRPAEVMPIRVAAHAFARGLPHRDLLLSPDHAVFIAADAGNAPGDVASDAPGVLIPIRYLQNGATIRPIVVAHVTYYHVELETHDLLLAEGLPAESYHDTGNRAAFANAPGWCWTDENRAPAPAGIHVPDIDVAMTARWREDRQPRNELFAHPAANEQQDGGYGGVRTPA